MNDNSQRVLNLRAADQGGHLRLYGCARKLHHFPCEEGHVTRNAREALMPHALNIRGSEGGKRGSARAVKVWGTPHRERAHDREKRREDAEEAIVITAKFAVEL